MWPCRTREDELPQTSEQPEDRGARRFGAGLILRVLLLLVLALVIVYLLSHSGDVSAALSVAHRLAWPLLILAVVTQLFSYISSGELLRATLQQSGHSVSLARATMIGIATSTLSMVPGGGLGSPAAIYKWTRNRGVPTCSAAVAGVVVTLFNAASMLFFAIVSAILLFGRHRLGGNTAIALVIVGVGIVIILVLAVMAALRPSWLTFVLAAAGRVSFIQRSSWLRRADQRAAQLRATLAELRQGRWGRAALSAALNVAFDAATLALVFDAAGAPVGAATLLAGYGLPTMLGQASFLPGGLAVTELSMTALYVSFGLRPSVVIASVLTYRLVSLWLPAVSGLPLIAYLQLDRRPIRRAR